jgi:hypothetical protein
MNRGRPSWSITTRTVMLLLLVSLTAACGQSDPGPLAGSWRLSGLVPMTIHFRHGETEALGIIEKVSYERKGSDVIVNYTSGLMKGSGIRYTITGPNTARCELGTLQRIK